MTYRIYIMFKHVPGNQIFTVSSYETKYRKIKYFDGKRRKR